MAIGAGGKSRHFFRIWRIADRFLHEAQEKFRRRKKEKRDTDEAHGNDAMECWQVDGNLVGCGGSSLERCRADDQHDDSAGHSAHGEWEAGFGNAAAELAGVFDLEQPSGGRGFDECPSGLR